MIISWMLGVVLPYRPPGGNELFEVFNVLHRPYRPLGIIYYSKNFCLRGPGVPVSHNLFLPHSGVANFQW